MGCSRHIVAGHLFTFSELEEPRGSRELFALPSLPRRQQLSVPQIVLFIFKRPNFLIGLIVVKGSQSSSPIGSIRSTQRPHAASGRPKNEETGQPGLVSQSLISVRLITIGYRAKLCKVLSFAFLNESPSHPAASLVRRLSPHPTVSTGTNSCVAPEGEPHNFEYFRISLEINFSYVIKQWAFRGTPLTGC